MRLLRNSFLFAVLLGTVLAGMPTPAHALRTVYIRDRWIGPTKTGTRAKDSTWVFLKPCTGDNSVAFPVASSDTFYIDLSDAAWNDPEFSNYIKLPSDSTETLTPAQMARDSIGGALNISFIPNIQNGDADSLTFDFSINRLGAISNSKMPWGGAGAAANWESLHQLPLFDGSAVTHKEFTFSVSSYPLYRQLGVASTQMFGLVNSAVSRSCLMRGVTLIRLIVARRGTFDAGGTPTKYAIRVGYPATTGLGSTPQSGPTASGNEGVTYMREKWVNATKTNGKDSSWVLIKPPNNFASAATVGTQFADTFYVDLRDAAWNSPRFTKWQRFATDSTVANKIIHAVKDSIPALSLAIVTNVADADLDSTQFFISAPLFGNFSGNRGPWGTAIAPGANGSWTSIHTTATNVSITGTTQKIFNFSVPGTALTYAAWGGGLAAMPNSALSRSVIQRGVTRLRVIAKCNSNDTRSVANPKWSLLVAYPAVTGLGETSRASE
jgi:hypothetical protein